MVVLAKISDFDEIGGRPAPEVHASKVFPMLVERLSFFGETHLLDVGPVSENNLNFIAGLVKKLYTCDMFLRLIRERRKQAAADGLTTLPDPDLIPPAYWRHLDYPDQTFHGILLWDLLDRLPDEAAKTLAGHCARMLKPGGFMMVVALGENQTSGRVDSFTLGTDFTLTPKPQPHLQMGFRFRHTRKLAALLSPLVQLRSYVFRNGTREFLFERV